MRAFPVKMVENVFTTNMQVYAYQDLGCLGRIKYVYHFYAPISEKIIESFSGCEITHIKFSKYISRARDLLKIRKTDAFQADIIVGGFSAIVYFAKRPDRSSRRLSEAFDRCLHNAGYGPIKYLRAPKPHCDQCPVRYLKRCS